MTKLAYIYALTDPETGEVRYVGKADNVGERLRKHLLPSALAIKCRRTSWLKGLLNAGKAPVLAVIEAVPHEQWKERECFWISFYNAIGRRLVNTAEGGTGGVKSEWITDEARANMSKAQMGKKRDPAAIEKMAAKRRGVPRDPSTIAKMSAAHKGRTPSAACKAAQLAAVKGSKRSDETKAKMSASAKGRPSPRRRAYVAVNAEGQEFAVEILDQFCAVHGLDRARMSGLANGDPKRSSHKGWTCKFKL